MDAPDLMYGEDIRAILEEVDQRIGVADTLDDRAQLREAYDMLCDLNRRFRAHRDAYFFVLGEETASSFETLMEEKRQYALKVSEKLRLI